MIGMAVVHMRRIAWLVLSLVLVLIFLLLAYIFLWDPRRSIPQEEFLPRAGQDPYLMPAAKDATSSVCTDQLPCRWAVSSETATVMMFDDKDEARAATTALPDSHQSSWLVVRFEPGRLSSQEQKDFMRGVDGIFHSEDAWIS